MARDLGRIKKKKKVAATVQLLIVIFTCFNKTMPFLKLNIVLISYMLSTTAALFFVYHLPFPCLFVFVFHIGPTRV